MRYFWTREIVSAVIFGCMASTAFAGSWTVVQTSADAKYTTDRANWRVITPGMVLPDNSWVNTGKRGRLTIQKDTNIVNVNPGTLAGIRELGGSLDKTVIAQQTGSVSLDLVHKSAPWMTVQTPFLAAVVKGTKFSVTIGKTDTTVDVSRGRVGVTDPRRGETVDIVTGQRATVDATSRRSMKVAGAGKVEPVRTVQPTAPVLPMTPDQAKMVKTEREKSGTDTTDQTTDQNNGAGDNQDQNRNDNRDQNQNRDNTQNENRDRNRNQNDNQNHNDNGNQNHSQNQNDNGSQNDGNGDTNNGIGNDKLPMVYQPDVKPAATPKPNSQMRSKKQRKDREASLNRWNHMGKTTAVAPVLGNSTPALSPKFADSQTPSADPVPEAGDPPSPDPVTPTPDNEGGGGSGTPRAPGGFLPDGPIAAPPASDPAAVPHQNDPAEVKQKIVNKVQKAINRIDRANRRLLKQRF